MASHHHHCHPTTTACCCWCCSSSHQPPPPDPLFQCQSTSSHHLLHPTTQPHLSSPCSPFNLQSHLHQYQAQYYYPPQTHKQRQHFQRLFHRQQEEEKEEQTNNIASSLLRRISALESSIHHRSSGSFSLRDAAASAIQTHFRAFLVRRSRTLRQLKELASIKSVLNILKYNLSNNTHLDSPALYRRAMDLLVKLEFIQGVDPMIRDGKKSISRELIRLMEYLDESSLKRHEIATRSVKTVRFGGKGTKTRVSNSDQTSRATGGRGLKGDERELLEQLRKKIEKIEAFSRVSEGNDEKDVELQNPKALINGGVSQTRIGFQAKPKKSVTFAENGNVHRVYRSRKGQVSIGECNSIDGSDSEIEHVDELSREMEEIGVSSKEAGDEEETGTEDESPQMRSNIPVENEDGSFVFSAPLPLKMEPRADHLNNKKTVKFIN